MPGFRSLALISSLISKDLWNKCIDDFLLFKLVESRLTGQARIQNAPARRFVAIPAKQCIYIGPADLSLSTGFASSTVVTEQKAKSRAKCAKLGSD
jgi:hypothetical protein